MGRGRRGLFDALMVLPWPAGLVVGVVGFLAIHYGIPAWFSSQTGPFAHAFARANPVAPLAWAFLAACTFLSLLSGIGSLRTRRLLDTRTTLESIASLGWRDFERLTGEAFRRRGYAVEETGLGGADGGIDLILRRDGKRILVQCKQWRCRRVKVNVVREMYGLLVAHTADEVRIAAMGGFTRDAERFARGKPIALIDGETLLAMIREVQSAETAPQRQRIEPAIDGPRMGTPCEPECPRCGARMVKRTNRRNGNMFWGCSTYPACRGTQ